MKRSVVNKDERTVKNTGTAAVITLACVWFALLVIGIYKTVKYGAESTTEEILLFLGSLLLFLIFKHRKDGLDMPESFFGTPLPIGLDKADKKARIKAYVTDSVLNAVILAALNVTLNAVNSAFDFTTIALESPILTILVNAGLDTVVIGCIFMLLNYCWGEHNVKKYHKMLEDAEED